MRKIAVEMSNSMLSALKDGPAVGGRFSEGRACSFWPPNSGRRSHSRTVRSSEAEATHRPSWAQRSLHKASASLTSLTCLSSRRIRSTSYQNSLQNVGCHA